MPTFTELMQQATSLEEARRAGAYIQAERMRRIGRSRLPAKPAYMPLIQKGMPPAPTPRTTPEPGPTPGWQPTTTPYYTPTLGQQLQTGRPPGGGMAPMAALPPGYQRAEDGSLVPETFWDKPDVYKGMPLGPEEPSWIRPQNLQWMPYIRKGMPRPLPISPQTLPWETRPGTGFSTSVLKEMTSKPEGKIFIKKLMNTGMFADQARDYLGKEIGVKFEALTPPVTPYGLWVPRQKLVMLYGTDVPIAIHEMAHAWWEPQHAEKGEGLVRALIRFAEDGPAQRQYPEAAEMAHLYIEDKIEAEPSWMTTPVNGEHWNDHEIFAGFAGHIGGDIRLLPPYIRGFYKDFLIELPTESPHFWYPTNETPTSWEVRSYA